MVTFQARRQAGFTIVELLIVIVVIGILAVITIIAYNGIQSRANDSKTRTAANQLEKAIRTYTLYTSRMPLGGYGSTQAVGSSGCVDGSDGWFAKGIFYTCTVEDALLSQNLITSNMIVNLPKNKKVSAATGVSTFMFYSCGTGRYALLWYLENPSTADTASYDAISTTCGYGNGLRNTYGMQAGSLIQLL
jgi:general secretion pathway protein G